jgi:hypothetical protein
MIERDTYLVVCTDSVDEARLFFGRPAALVRLHGMSRKGPIYHVWVALYPPADLEEWDWPKNPKE